MTSGGYYSGTGDRMMYLSGNNMVQDFPNELESTQFGGGNNMSESKWMGASNNLSPGGGKNKGDPNQLSQIPESGIELNKVTDYGLDYYKLLRQFHKERTQSSDPTMEELFNTYKILKQSVDNSNQARVKAAMQAEQMQINNRNPHSYQPKASRISSETQVRLAGSEFKSKTDISQNKTLGTKLELVKDRDPDSVRFTIKTHHTDYNEQQELFRKEEQGILRLKKNLEVKKMKEKIKRKQDAVKAKYVQSQLYQNRKPDEGEMFVKELKRRYKMQNLMDIDYMYPQKLYEYWLSLPESQRPKCPQTGDPTAQNQTPLHVLSRYYNARLNCLYEHCSKQKGTKPEDPKVVFKHWKEIYPAVEKRDKDLDFECDYNAKVMIEDWMALRKREQEILKKRFKEELSAVKTANQISQMSKSQQPGQSGQPGQPGQSGQPGQPGQPIGPQPPPPLGKDGKPMSQAAMKAEKQKEYIEKISKPKDRLIRGKTIVELKSKFPNDKILQQLLVDEFGNDRIVKKPLEYDHVDSDEEDAIKRRHVPHHGKKKGDDKEKKRSKSNEGHEGGAKKDWITEEQKEMEQSQLLMKRFKDLSKRYKKEKEQDLKKEALDKTKLSKEMEKFNTWLTNKVTNYRKLMLQKQSQEVPSETQYLSDVSLK